MRPALAALWLALLAAGCAAPADARFAADEPIPPGRARLYVYRARSSAGPRDAGGVSVDHRPLAVLQKGEYVSVVLPPGEHRLEAGESEVPRLGRAPARTLELPADRATYCSLSADPGAALVAFDFHCSGDAAGHAELRDCRRGQLDRTVDWTH